MQEQALPSDPGSPRRATLLQMPEMPRRQSSVGHVELCDLKIKTGSKKGLISGKENER